MYVKNKEISQYITFLSLGAKMRKRVTKIICKMVPTPLTVTRSNPPGLRSP